MKLKTIILGLTAVVAFVVNGGTKIIKNGDTLVFMGDSITDNGNKHAYGYLHLVDEGLKANGVTVKWLGKGISGQTASQMRARFQGDVINNHANVVTIFGGVNDCGLGHWTKEAGGSSTPDDVAAMAQMALDAGITPVLLSPTGVNSENFHQHICDYAAEVKKIAQEKGVRYAATYEAFRAYVEDESNPKINGQFKAVEDGTHMGIPGDRILAIEVLKAFGFDTAAELNNAQAAWNRMPAFTSFHPSVKVTEAEYMAVKVAAARAGKTLEEFQKDLFTRGAQMMSQNPVRVNATSGAAIQLSATAPAGFVSYDQMLGSGRTMSTHDSLPSIANYAMLAAVHELPAVTDADLPTEPVVAVDTSVFSKQVEFTCSGYTGVSTLRDFPVAVRLSADSPSGFAYSDMSDSTKGDELRFADAEGRSLSYEIEAWDANGTSLVWVKVPELTQATSFSMYYGGDPADSVSSSWTWNSADYVGVWHMSENGGTAYDSANGIDAEPVGAYASTMQKSTSGVFGKGRVNSSKTAAYQGQSMLQVHDSTLLDCGSDFTFSGWVRMTDVSADNLGRIVSRNRGGSYAPEWELRFHDFTTLNAYAGSNTPVSGTVPSVQNAWVHVASVFNGTTLSVYLNGTQAFTSSISAVQDSDNKIVFGAFDVAVTKGHFVGDYDEFRLRDAVSSADWVKAEYDQSKTSFLASGSVSDVTGGQPTHTHTWGTPAYTWTQTSSGYDCKATVACTSVSSHTKSMSVSATYSVVTQPTEEAEGLGRYTATFTSAPFVSTQTKDVTIPKLTPPSSGGDEGGSSNPPVVNPPTVDPTGATAASGDTTGATDVQTIQSLIDAAAPTKGTVKLGAGTFYINAELNVHDGVTLTGLGMDKTVIKAASDGFRGAVLDGGAKLEFLTVTGFKVTTKWVHGGGVSIKDGSVSWCCISNNVLASNNCYGGGIAFPESGKGSVDHSVIAFNQAGTVTSGGGGIAIYSSPNTITIDTCLVYGNTTSVSDTSGNGGGIGVFMNLPTVTIRNTTITGNTSTGKAGGFSSDSYNKNKVTLVNCIVSGNTAGSDANVYGTAGTGWSNNLFDGDPGFTNAAAHDYTLTASSPAKAAGMTYAGIGQDLNGAEFANPPSMGCYEFGSVPSGGEEGGDQPPALDPIALGEPVARPSTDYNGSVVTVSFTGDIPEGAGMLAKLMLNGDEFAGSVGSSVNEATFVIPSSVVTAGNTYEGIIMLFVGEQVCMKDVTLVQGALVADENASWIRESATSFGTTGAWAGEKAAVASGKISVSNATFTASKAAPQAAVVTVESTFVFGDATDEAFNNTSRAGIKVVSVNGTKRYAFKTATGAATNLTVAAKTDSAVRVTVTLDNATHKVSYAVDGTSLGQYAMAEKTAGVATVRYEGETDVTSLNGSYVLNGLDTNLAKVGDTEYATVAEALAAGNGQVQLLWDSSWDPAASGDYTFNKAGFNLVIGGSLAYSVKDNGNGTVTVSVTGGDEEVEAPAPTAVTMSGNSVKVGVENVKPNLWYALSKTTDLTKPFVIDTATWMKGSELIGGTKELVIALYGSEPQAFYRVVVSTTAP